MSVLVAAIETAMCNDVGMSSSRSLFAIASSVAIAACTYADGGVDTGPQTTTTFGDSESSGDGDPSGDGDVSTCVSALDVLFVIDNSGSMGEKQTRIATSVPMLIAPLDAAGVDWRIGVTTTDSGNPWCDSTTPEAGNLVLSSCKSRIDEFVFGEEPPLGNACDGCTLDEIEIVPTTTHVDSNEKPRLWVEKIGGVTNLANDVDPAAALACFLPMGITGCGFESQLESMYLSLARAQNVDDDEYGFLRPGASLLVVIISDEVDCSYNDDYAEIFELDGNRAFWSDPAAMFPTSAVCWNAGVSCSGDPSDYDSCDPINKDVNGNEGVDGGAAVLHPLSRYLGQLDAIEAQIREIDPSGAVRISLIAGVASDGSVHYADVGETDPEYQHWFGIGPGCTAPPPMGHVDNITAVPPVRMRNVATQSGGIMRSVCADEYASALADMASRSSPSASKCATMAA
jgi:hypothetical protein